MLAAVFAFSPASAGASADKLISNLKMTSHRPGTATGLKLHLVWPSDGPDGRPKPETKGVFRLPPGTVVDETAIPTCMASDAELQSQGYSGCPSPTALGPGVTTLLTGVGPPMDPFIVDDYWFHGPGQLIAVYTSQGSTSPGLSVNRVKIKRSRFVATPSLPPGFPPGSKTVPKRSDQRVFRRVSEAGAFVTTPPHCPRNHHWVAHTKVTYEDGSVQRARSVTPCVRSTG
jgi:hypothetical protein